jgi:hypothetical protein
MAPIFACILLPIRVNQKLSLFIINPLSRSMVMTWGGNGTTMAPLSGALRLPAGQSGEDLEERVSRENHSAGR